MAAMQAMASGPGTDEGFASQLARGVVDAISLVLPALESVTRTEWLLYGPPPAGAYASALGGLALYTVLLAAAGLFDFHRRNW